MKLQSIHQFSLPVLGLVALCALSSCANREFTADWREANGAASHTGVEGPWSGTWESHATGHKGGLRCVVQPSETSCGTYDFHYWASWGKAISGSFHVTYAVREEDGKFHVSGEKDLGKLGGVYTHTGIASASEFEATYKSAKDHGVFKMNRPGPSAAPDFLPPANRPSVAGRRFAKSPYRTTP